MLSQGYILDVDGRLPPAADAPDPEGNLAASNVMPFPGRHVPLCQG